MVCMFLFRGVFDFQISQETYQILKIKLVVVEFHIMETIYLHNPHTTKCSSLLFHTHTYIFQQQVNGIFGIKVSPLAETFLPSSPLLSQSSKRLCILALTWILLEANRGFSVSQRLWPPEVTMKQPELFGDMDVRR